ncbi:c-type cytochrome [Stieleria sp. JC731]|uniref:PVC-type heme-binding CxxCH protein n=1 Tax=Pirellulaceae TaxID=2691357 RepID=UPI001E5D2A50|nr:PVC-type heme-binding CxxCH protein [Stieleria sp. JC731]MCC9600360.1 c-type cytochrome [Stieleria sp. JC731]
MNTILSSAGFFKRAGFSALRLRCVTVVVTCLSLASFQNIQADDFPEIYNNEADRDASPMPAEEAAKAMALQAGFSSTVFASEPEVQNPIAMAWDDRGRMWVAENYTYSDRNQHFDLSLRDRVVILHDEDGDGKSDSRKVFTDKVQMLTSVETGRGGVWLMCPPQLLFIPDADQDDVPDGPPQVVLDGFTVADANYHNFANGLRWGPDGWLYGRSGHSCPGEIGLPGTPQEKRVPIDGGIWRYHPDWKTVEVLTHGTVNPWGHDWDADGELFFINTVIGHLWHCMPGAHFIESFGESPNPLVYERLDMIADHYHYDRNGSWQESRDGAANELGGGHAHIGMMIYQAGKWPVQYQNKLFTLNMHGLRCNVETLRRVGAGYVGSHEPDFFICKDPFFRGLEISTGPDGDAYVLDWSDTGECHDHTGVHRTSGRIYKIRYEGAPDLQTPLTKPACLTGTGPLHNLWRDYIAGQTSPERLRSLLTNEDEHLRTWAIRLLTDRWPLDTFRGPMKDTVYPDDPQTRQAFIELAANDPSGLVLSTLASTLQRLPVDQRLSLAIELIRRDEFASDRDLPAMIWFGLMPVADRYPEQLVAAISDCRIPKIVRWSTRAVATKVGEHPSALNHLLTLANSFPLSMQQQVLAGMGEAYEGWHKVDVPDSWSTFAKSKAAQSDPQLVRRLNLLFGDGRALDELRDLAKSSRTPLKTRVSALQSLIDAKPSDLRQICESLLDQRELNAVAAKGLSQFDDPTVGIKLTQMYRRFHPNDRPAVIEILVSRPSFADALLDRLDADRNPIDRGDVSAFHARQIIAFGQDDLTKKLAERWGTLRDSPADRRAKIDDMKASLTKYELSNANLSQGRALFKKTCSQCHRLFGEGENIGPDLTGAQRSSLDYLLENILDPSAVVGKDHRMSIVLLDDGRVLNGLVVSKNEKTLVIQTQSQKETISMDSVEQIRVTPLSPMPDGLLTTLSDEQVRDLIGYLMSPTQVSMP